MGSIHLALALFLCRLRRWWEWGAWAQVGSRIRLALGWLWSWAWQPAEAPLALQRPLWQLLDAPLPPCSLVAEGLLLPARRGGAPAARHVHLGILQGYKVRNTAPGVQRTGHNDRDIGGYWVAWSGL